MKILIIGAGLAGITTAFVLQQRGHAATVIDRQDGPGRETSFANGALLTPSMAEPWNAPGSWRVLLRSIYRSDTALQLRLRSLPGLARWGAGFLRNSRSSAFQRNTLNNLRLALYSMESMRALRAETGIEYGHSAAGALKIFADRAALDEAADAANHRIDEGLVFRRLSPPETIELEPALAQIESRLAGSLYYEIDEIGDAHRFCCALAERAKDAGVEFRFGVNVTGLKMRSGTVAAVVTRDEGFVADRYIVAAGSFSTPLLRGAAIRLPVRPAKGYSVTFDLLKGSKPLRIPVIDDEFHAAIVPLEGAIRVAGTAEFSGYDLTPNPKRIANLAGLVKQVLPEAPVALAEGQPWCGLRAMSVDGVPIIGQVMRTNLFVNTGHGHLGWTMAAGSAQMLADLMSRVTPALDPAPYDPNRFH